MLYLLLLVLYLCLLFYSSIREPIFLNTDLIIFLEVLFILFDDIFTTGNTVNECSKVIKMAGAKEVAILTIAVD